MSRTHNILIFGATGLIGEHITSAILSQKDKFNRIVVFTSENTIWTKSDEVDDLKRRGAEIIAGDFRSASDVSEALEAAETDTVVSCLGRPVIAAQANLIECAAKSERVKKFFPSEYGTDVEFDETSKGEKPHQQKLKIRELLRKVGNQEGKLEYTCVVTGPYGDADGGLYLGAKKVEDEEEGTFDVKRKRAVLLGADGEGKISLTTMRDVGKLVVAALLHPDGVRNKAIKVNSFTTTPKALLEEFERQTGGEKWDVKYTSLERLEELERAAWEKGVPRAGTITLRRIWTSGKTLYEKRDNGLIGMEKGVDSVEDAVRQAVQVQMGQPEK